MKSHFSLLSSSDSWHRQRLPTLLLIAAAAQAHSQSADKPQAATLPDAPSMLLAQQSEFASSSPIQNGSASLSGTVVDPSGAVVVNARVTLLDSSRKALATVQSGPSGEYSFVKLPAGNYQVMITATGFSPFTTLPVGLTDSQSFVVTAITLQIANQSTEVNVRANDPELATVQIRAAEKQRILGLIPNFYESFIYDAQPLTTKQKYTFAIRETLDPIRFLGTGIGAGLQQANGSFKGYGSGAPGYAKRYAALYGNGLTNDILSHAVFPALFHEDPRYFYQGTGSIKSRALHAASFAILTRGDDGRTKPNYSYLLGDIGSGALSNLYYPHADRGAGLAFTNAFISLGTRVPGGLLKEFVLPKLTRNKAGAGRP